MLEERSEPCYENDEGILEELSHARNFYRVRWHNRIVCELRPVKQCPLGGVDCRTCAVARGRSVE